MPPSDGIISAQRRPDKITIKELINMGNNPETRPIRKFPGYHITQDGRGFSSRNSTKGDLKPIQVDKHGFVRMQRHGEGSRAVKVTELIADAWRERTPLK